ncbi:hypothetical protein ACFLY6_03170 [Candidatus Dependentiae bacterium]
MRCDNFIKFLLLIACISSFSVSSSDDFNERIRQLQDRIRAREKAQKRLEERAIKEARKKAQISTKKLHKKQDSRVEFLKNTFKKRKKDREKEFSTILRELRDIESSVGGAHVSSDVDAWTERQERKAEKLREKLRKERRLLEENRRAAREEFLKKAKLKKQKIQRRFEKEKRAKLEKEVEEGRYFYLHLSPSWPIHAMVFDRQGFGMLGIGYRGFPRAFMGDGSRDDLDKLEYYGDTLYMKDLVCECGLLSAGTVATKGGAWDDDPINPELERNPFYVLADSQVTLESKRKEIPIVFGGSMAVGDEKNVLSVFFPLTYHSRELNVTVKAPTGADDFGNAALMRYIGDPESLLKEAFDARSVDMGGTDSGFITCNTRVSFYRKAEIKKKMKTVLGLTASLPVFADEGKDSFQQPRLGDDFFTSMGLFVGGLVSHSKFLNPHIFGQIRVFLSNHFLRRLGHYKTYDGSGTLPLLMTNFVQETGSVAFSNVLDSKVSLFAEELTQVNVARPCEIRAVLGNQMREVLGIASFLDIFYMLRIKGEDDVTVAESGDTRQRELSGLLFKEQEIEHKFGFNWQYQKSSEFTFEIGGMYTLAGQAVPECYEIKAAVRAEF